MRDLWSSGGPVRPGPHPSRAPEGALPHIRSVAEITALLRDTIRAQPGLRDVWVEGEVGQVTVSSAGHCYFTLKDERAQLRCVLFRDERLMSPFQPETGLRLVAHGRVDLFEPQGAYQLYVDTLQPAGFGDLAIRFETLKAKLAAEGLFDQRRKRPLPEWPEVVGVATSFSGAVFHDMRRVLARRWPLVRVVATPCQVQGAAAPQSIVRALARLARWTDPATGRGVDVVILARGGGSLEDLWAFNDESVVRAVAAHPRPIVVGVGHESDVTLAEFAADVRAATPSVAAELVVPSRTDQAARLASLSGRLASAVQRSLAVERRLLDAERRALEGFRPAALLAGERERVGLLLDRATRAVAGRLAADGARVDRSRDRLPLLIEGRLTRGRTDLATRAASLTALGPYATLARGYAIVRDKSGAIVRSADAVSEQDPLEVRLAAGELGVRVEAVRSERR